MGLAGSNGIPIQHGIAIDGAGHSRAGLIVHDGDRIDLDVIDDILDSGIVAGDRDRIVLVPIVKGMSAEELTTPFWTALTLR